MIDSPWWRMHVENHLIWGNYKYKRQIFISILLLTPVCYWFITGENFFSLLTEILLGKGGFLGVVIMPFFMIFGNFQTNALFWAIYKLIAMLCSPMLILMGVVKHLEGSVEGIPLIITGLLLFPSIEFIPQFVCRQKIFTLIRLAIVIPMWTYITIQYP